MISFLYTFFFLLSVVFFCPDAMAQGTDTEATPPAGTILEELLPIGYSGDEFFKYDVFWSGGIKIGEVRLTVSSAADSEESYSIEVHVTTKGGAVHWFYPINDRYLTLVRGHKRLPYYYEMWQKEGKKYEAHRVMFFDQAKGEIIYRKNEDPEIKYVFDGDANNEFSAFLNSRLMEFELDKPFLVPTFADKKVTKVSVYPRKEEHLENTVIGDVDTMLIMPIMNFKGLYDKQGDTIIWYTHDECRVPVKINSKIVIGSLTAQLTEYENTACNKYPKHYIQKTGKASRR